MSIELISFCDECDGTIVGDNRSRTFCGECYDPLVKERNKLADELAEAKSEIAWLRRHHLTQSTSNVIYRINCSIMVNTEW